MNPSDPCSLELAVVLLPCSSLVNDAILTNGWYEISRMTVALHTTNQDH
jgi:hypothetical protein